MKAIEIAKGYEPYVIEMRRKFHQYPEVSRQEVNTCRMICEELAGMGLSPRVVCETGVLVDIGDKSRSGRMAAIRTDIDALQVEEETGAPYASRIEGMMHACGHDAHIAMALASARILKDMEEQLPGGVRILFEPAEEVADGAFRMMDAGALDGVDTIYGTHVWAGIPAGTFSAQAGPRMASADFFTITVKGRSSHGSLPQNGVDPIVAAAAIIQNIQVALHREIPATEPSVVSFCQIHGGNTDNAIPDTVTIGGTGRAFSPEVRKAIPEIMERVLTGTAAAYRAEASLDYRWGSSALINDPEAARRAQKAIAENFGAEALKEFPATTGGEDFAEYLGVVPGVFVFLGIENKELGAVYPNHSSHFTIDESALIKGAAAAVQYCLDYLGGNGL